jgi:hypothetical protein
MTTTTRLFEYTTRAHSNRCLSMYKSRAPTTEWIRVPKREIARSKWRIWKYYHSMMIARKDFGNTDLLSYSLLSWWTIISDIGEVGEKGEEDTEVSRVCLLN